MSDKDDTRSSGAESSGGDETASKKKRRSKPRGGRGHGGKSKPEKSKNPEGGDPPVGPGTAARGTGCRIPNAGPGILPDPEDATFMRPTIELKLPKHLALKAAKAAALVPMPPAGGSAGGKALRRTPKDLRVETFNPYARKTPVSTPNALTPATQLAMSMIDFALDSPALHTRNAHTRLAARGFAFPSPKAGQDSKNPYAAAEDDAGQGWGVGRRSSGGGRAGAGSSVEKQKGDAHDVSKEVQVAVEWWVKFLCREEGSPAVSDRQKAVFRDTLYKELECRCMYHWYPTNPQRGSGYRSVSTDDKIDPSLMRALTSAAIHLKCLPKQVLMFVNPGEVKVRPTYSHYSEVLYPQPAPA